MMLAGRFKRRYEKPMGGLWGYRRGRNYIPRIPEVSTDSFAANTQSLYRRLDP